LSREDGKKACYISVNANGHEFRFGERKEMFVRVFAVILAVILILSASSASSQEPGWSGRFVVVGAEREQVRSSPILQRPYRPFHFYGNAVRRANYRGRMLPQPQDWMEGFAALITWR
jgi:hypothetical protein